MASTLQSDPRYGPMLDNLILLGDRRIALQNDLAARQADLDRCKATKHRRGDELVVKADGSKPDAIPLDQAAKALTETVQRLNEVEHAIAQQEHAMQQELPAASSRHCRTVLADYVLIVDRITAAASALADAVEDERSFVSMIEGAGCQCVHPIVQPGIDPGEFGGPGGNSRLIALCERTRDAHQIMTAQLPAKPAAAPAPPPAAWEPLRKWAKNAR